MKLRTLLAGLGLAILPIIYLLYLVQNIRAHQTSPAVISEFVWIIPYIAASIEWLRLGSKISPISRGLIILTIVITFLFLFTSTA